MITLRNITIEIISRWAFQSLHAWHSRYTIPSYTGSEQGGWFTEQSHTFSLHVFLG